MRRDCFDHETEYACRVWDERQDDCACGGAGVVLELGSCTLPEGAEKLRAGSPHDVRLQLRRWNGVCG